MPGMALGEFDLIARFFSRPVRRAVLGGGDDCALLQPSAGQQIAVTSDLLIEGRHFISTVPPRRLGHKSLAVNLSDLAACGARPVAFTLAIAMPAVDEVFLGGFSEGLYALADEHGVELVGGDTTAGPLTIAITAIGEVPTGRALRRDGARAGDAIWVSHPSSGGIGDARLALEALRGRVQLAGEAFEQARRAMEQPQPRVQLGIALRGLASSAIDLSDGLLGDLAHVLERSGVGATVQVDEVPRSRLLSAQPLAVQRDCTLAGGDDYELLFTVGDDPGLRDGVLAAARSAGVAVTCIGRIEADRGLRLVDAGGRAVSATSRGFDHFAP